MRKSKQNLELLWLQNQTCYDKRAQARIVLFLFWKELKNNLRSKMFDKNQIYAPFYCKRDICEIFKKEYSQLYKTGASANTYLIATWKNCYRYIKARGAQNYTKYTIFDELDRVLKPMVCVSGAAIQLIIMQRLHLYFSRFESLVYYETREYATLHAESCVSIVIDGAYQWAHGLPYLIAISKC